jgi:hypothetical protein
MELSSFNHKFYLVYYDEKLQLIDSSEQLLDKYKENLKKEKEKEKDVNNKKNNENNYNENNNNNNSMDYSNENNINNNINNNGNNEMNFSLNNSSFLIVSEFTYIPSSTFKITGPILSHELRKEIKDLSCLCRSWRLCKKNEENLLSIGDVIKLGRARLKIDTICMGEIYESCQISNNFSKTKSRKNEKNNKYPKTINNLKINSMRKSYILSSNKEMIEESKVSANGLNDHEISEDGVTNNQKDNIVNNLSEFSIQDSSRNLKPTCRICFLTNSEEENPLISPCKCSGSMKYIHYLCLKKCIEIKIIKKSEQNFKFYTWKSFSCEICKSEYPKYIRIKDSLFSLVDLEINYSSYVTCDYTLYDDIKKKTFRKGILIFKINDDNEEDIITVGRSQNNKIKLKDISVSRCHCNFIKKNNKLYIVDKGSKFGTLIYLNNSMYITPKKKEGTLISGKHWFSVNLQQNQGFFSKLFCMKCCGCGQIRQDGDIDVEGLLNNEESKFESKIRNRTKVELGQSGEKEDNENNDSRLPLIDELYQDYVLDLGDNIYLHKNTEIEDIKIIDKINK